MFLLSIASFWIIIGNYLTIKYIRPNWSDSFDKKLVFWTVLTSFDLIFGYNTINLMLLLNK